MHVITAAGFRNHQSTVWAANELRNVYLNLCCGIMNLTITVCLLVQVSGSTCSALCMLNSHTCTPCSGS